MNFNSFLDIVSWLVVILMYALLCGILAVIVDNVFGRRSSRWIFLTLGFPILMVVCIIRVVYWIVTWPLRYREARLLRETFGILDMSEDYRESNRIRVQYMLTYLAEEMDVTFKDQVKARSEGIAMGYYDWMASKAKKRFWKAHGLAKSNWFFVHSSYKDYLKK